MGFVNINGQSIHTSSLGSQTASVVSATSTGSWLISNGSGSSIWTNPTTKYIILGKEIEISGSWDSTISLSIASINILGKPFYDELKKQNVHLPMEIEEFLEMEFKILERDKKIDSVINDGLHKK
jgi:hypothetical protein